MNKIDLVNRLFSSVFDKTLNVLEKNTEAHFNLINTSLSLTSQVVSSCQAIGTKVQVHLENKKKSKAMGNNKRTNGKLSISRCKTPLRNQITSSRFVNRLITSNSNSNPNNNSEMSKCQSIGSLLSKSKLKEKVSLRSNTVKQLIPNMKKSLNNDHHSTINLKTTNNINASKRPVLTIGKQSNNSMKLNKHFSAAKAKNLKILNGNKQSIKAISKTMEDESFDKIFSVDDAMIINKEDPLLISPFGDKDLFEIVPDNMEDYSYSYSLKSKVKTFNVEEWCEDHLVLMIRYLTKTDIFRLLFVNKSFERIISQYLLSYLEEEKSKYKSLIASIENPITSYEHSPFQTQIQFTMKTYKAIALLNEPVINTLFTDSVAPSNDILLIYAIYFQLINHPLAIESDMKKIFWKKCCQYFIMQSNGKTGDFLQKMLSDSLVITSDNMYKLMRLVDGNLNKLTPSYFSKICGTTGLVVFFIQDVLEHLGISTNKTKRTKGYLIYKGIVDVLEKKIEQFKYYIH